MGLRVSGKVAPEKLKPVPLMVAELMVTAAVPLEVRVTGRVEEEPSVTLLKIRLAVLSDSCGLSEDDPESPEPLILP